MKMYETILDIAAPYDGILLDAYGVFWGGNGVGLLPGAKEAMEQLVASGKIVGVLSNATQLPSAEMEKVGKKGLLLGPHFHFYITSGEVASGLFQNGELPFPTPKKKYFLLTGVHPKYGSPYSLFANTFYEETKNVEEADFIYLPTPHLHGEDQTDPELFRPLVIDVAHLKLPMLCANPDRFAHEGNPARAVVRQGSIAAFYEELGGAVYYVGKPSLLSFAAAMKQFNSHGITDPAKIIMVGDTPETDIKGARNFGMASALITETGIMQDRENLDLHPHETPTFFIKRLGPDV
jgi:HAD superfamily hydrolase (TIGR01459 family)